MVELFAGVGSLSHYLRGTFHPIAAFDSDADARAVMSAHFPQCTMATDFASVMAAGDGDGTFLGAAKGARVAFASPPCSQTSVVNKQRDESSYAARLCIYMLQVLAVAPLEVMVFESTPAIMSALGGRLMAEMYAEMAALPIPYVPTILHIDPLRLGSSQGRTRVLTIMTRRDVFERKGAFMPPLSYQVYRPPLLLCGACSTSTRHRQSAKVRVMAGYLPAPCTATVT